MGRGQIREFGFNRIMIIGSPGSGKSTLARRLGQKLGLPVFHMDRDVFWLPGWTERPHEDRLANINRIVDQEAWVFEGFNSSTFHIRGARADMLIWLDFPLGLRLVRVIRRAVLGRGQVRADLAADCPERLDMLPGFIWYILRTSAKNRNKAHRFFDQFDGQKHRLQTVAEIDVVLNAKVWGGL